MQLKEANAAKEMEVARRRTAEEGYFEMKEKVIASTSTQSIHLIIMELGRFFVRTNLRNHAEGSQQMQSECQSAIQRVSLAGFPCDSLQNEGFVPTRHTLLWDAIFVLRRKAK